MPNSHRSNTIKIRTQSRLHNPTSPRTDPCLNSKVISSASVQCNSFPSRHHQERPHSFSLIISDPPAITTSTKVHLKMGDGEDGEELVHVKEGYFRYIDILFEWCRYMNPWQKNAVKALLNGEALTHPDHPLHHPGQDGIELYISTAESGKQNLLFSLKQLEYLQYYIHHYQLADPRVVKEMTAGGAIPWQEECNLDEVEVDNWIPLPMNVLLPEVIGTIEPAIFKSLSAIKKEMNRITKNNKHVKREAMMMRGTREEKSRAEAEIDNEREGPGLRRGPMRKSWGRDEKVDVEDGWGKRWKDEEEQNTATVETAVSDRPPSLVQSDGTSEDSRPPSSLYQTPDTPSQHYHHAQQALLLASEGGLVTALAHRPDSPPEGEPTESQAKIGRSLFIALDLVTWEKDESVILEIGWSAVWWQPVDPEKPFGEFEEMTDKGHYIVQDHLLHSKNGEVKPNHRDNYLHSNSLPIKQGDIALTVERLIADLSKRAGNGPTFMVLHSPKDQLVSEHAKYIQLGLFSVDWIETLRPTASEFPPYADESGLGQTFIIDTANLFGNIENGHGSDEGLNKTRKSLDDVALIMFGDTGAKPIYTANAGNRASYLIEVFLSIVTGPDLKELQEDYVKSQSPVASETSAISKPIDKVAREPITFVRPEVEQPTREEDEDSEEDGDGIKGVYFEDEEGELAEFVDDFKA